jgi:aryl-alcohol dehydrogenase-like predicted oxidoreductase
METRRFGRTGHQSTVIIFGAFAVGQVSQQEADRTVQLLLEHGVNHIDVAPSYHDAEQRLGPWLERHRDRFFLGCKTQLRDARQATAEMRRSLERLRVDRFDLYQLHAVTTMEELDACFAPGGSMETLLAARDEGLTRYLGITSHGWQAPAVERAALERYDFDSLLLPINGRMWADDDYRRDATAVLEMAAERDIGTMIIKTWVAGPWGGRRPRYHTWYEPKEQPDAIEQALNFTLSLPVTGAISAGDARLVPTILAAAGRCAPMSVAEQAAYVAAEAGRPSIFG